MRIGYNNFFFQFNFFMTINRKVIEPYLFYYILGAVFCYFVLAEQEAC